MYQNYNPMYSYYQTMRPPRFSGIFSNLRGRFHWDTILNNTQKTLNIINQAIPIAYQVRPMYQNMKTLFKIAGAVHDSPEKARKENTSFPSKESYTNKEQEKKETYHQEGLNFFL